MTTNIFLPRRTRMSTNEKNCILFVLMRVISGYAICRRQIHNKFKAK